jgi:hypothetical protein
MFSARFDVQRSDKVNYSSATVIKKDFSGSVKRIMFHFAKTSSDRDEWIEFKSPRIAPLYTKVPKKGLKNAHKHVHNNVQAASDVASASPIKEAKAKPAQVIDSKSLDSKTLRVNSGTHNGRKRAKYKGPADPTDQASFEAGGKSAWRRRRSQRRFLCGLTSSSV